jgi:basic membrane lipoprotein Med (substrate-binding protein (PBP1-ABC) superfamily)
VKKWTSWVALVVVFALLTACGDAGNYVKQAYPLVSADGNGSNLSKVYAAEGKTVPVVANELAQKEPPKEKSKESLDQMFLLYSDKVINIQKDPKDSNNTLVEVDSVQYAKEHYDSSFLQGFLAAALLQSVMGGGWFGNHRGNDYRGYSQTPTYRSSDPKTTSPTVNKDTPGTSDRTGTFSTGKKNTTSDSNIGSNSAGSDSSSRKNDGSTINRVPSNSQPSTSGRSGSFSKRK